MKWLAKVFLTDLITGLLTTGKYFFKKPVTYQYPEVRRPIGPRYRGRHRLVTNDDGSLLCVACGLCAAVCPSHCIYIEPGELPDGTRWPEVYEIETGRCVYCGFCVEVCPFDAVVLTQEHELAVLDKRELLYDINALRDKAPGKEKAG